MRNLGSLGASLVLALVVTGCATTASRQPVTLVPAGNYVLVEPASDTYNAVSINEWTFAARIGDQVHRGQHWIDSAGRLHMTDDAGPCAGQESIWTYSYSNNRVTLDLVQDLCTARTTPFPQRMVYERR